MDIIEALAREIFGIPGPRPSQEPVTVLHIYPTDAVGEWDYSISEDGYETDQCGTVIAEQSDQAYDLAVEDAAERYGVDL